MEETKKWYKKWWIWIIGFIFVIIILPAMIGCSDQEQTSNQQEQQETVEPQTEQIPEAEEETPQVEQTPEVEEEIPAEESKPTYQQAGNFVGNANSKKLHNLAHGACQNYVNMMNESNKVFFNSEQEGIDAGYYPCKRCD